MSRVSGILPRARLGEILYEFDERLVRVMSPFQIETGAKAPQRTPRELAFFT